ncbi:hypothetical protein [Aliarcobacter butzleri]|uniref:hypothetical protein n=1 Tax=Aliarcobacter butzleri TaxID=28197 RepID=UPI0024DE5ECD|nr:hypothetical protein [Aliarcobacter butzleri]MDK2082024.1 hypothetical protein [Aliarcobacter butzleri]
MKPTLIPSATKDTLIVPKLKKGIDGKLVFKKIDNPMVFEVEIIYSDKSLGRYNTTNFNEIILMFFEKLAKHNNGSPEFVELKLSKLEKNYLIDKIFIDNQLQNAENFSDKDDLKNKIIQNFISYPLEYSDKDVNYIIGLTEKYNIIRRTLEEQNLLMKDLASAIGINVNTLRSQASKNDVPSQTKKSIELYIENIKLKKELEKYKKNE